MSVPNTGASSASRIDVPPLAFLTHSPHHASGHNSAACSRSLYFMIFPLVVSG